MAKKCLRTRLSAVLRDPAVASGIGQWSAIQAAAPSLGVEVTPINTRDAGEIERAITAVARKANAGLIVTAGSLIVHRDLLIELAARLAINLKTARALGLTAPPSILVRADEVIE